MRNHYCQRLCATLLLCSLSANHCFSQSLLPGEIRIEHISALSYLATFTIYFDQPEPKEFIVVNWGDSQSIDSLYNPVIAECGNETWHGFSYSGVHTYSQSGVYTVSYSDQYLVGGISNIDNSSEQSLLLTASIMVSESIDNNTPIVLCPIWEWGCCDWIFNNQCDDTDGDSLSYELTTILDTDYTPTTATIDPITGDFLWSPQESGNFAIAITIRDWRLVDDTVLNLSSVTRYMLLNILDVSTSQSAAVPNSLFLYPNPTTNELNLNCNSAISHIEISELSGRVVLSNPINAIQTKVNTESLLSGCYFLIATLGNGTRATKKFFKE